MQHFRNAYRLILRCYFRNINTLCSSSIERQNMPLNAGFACEISAQLKDKSKQSYRTKAVQLYINMNVISCAPNFYADFNTIRNGSTVINKMLDSNEFSYKFLVRILSGTEMKIDEKKENRNCHFGKRHRMDTKSGSQLTNELHEH